MNLNQLQQKFIKALTSNSDICDYIQPHPKVSTQQQFSIYQNAFLSRFQKTLKNIYPVCHKLVGEEFFQAMAREYILQTPSHSQDLNYYGESLPVFISAFAPAQSLPYLADVARLEWAWHYIYAGADSPDFDFERLAASYASHGDAIVFSLPPRSSLLTSTYPIHQIWKANQENSNFDAEIILNHDEQYYFLIWRKVYDLRIEVLSATQWKILELIQQKLSLSEICNHNLGDVDIAAALSFFVRQSWIADFK